MTLRSVAQWDRANLPVGQDAKKMQATLESVFYDSETKFPSTVRLWCAPNVLHAARHCWGDGLREIRSC
ncbi:MAG: hypothetical protein C5B46_00780 [Proteobacteria bacterium]|nr:MAG: hypothetical protein C5B46_00780 [Pseudomonadota bacterium]